MRTPYRIRQLACCMLACIIAMNLFMPSLAIAEEVVGNAETNETEEIGGVQDLIEGNQTLGAPYMDYDAQDAASIEANDVDEGQGLTGPEGDEDPSAEDNAQDEGYDLVEDGADGDEVQVEAEVPESAVETQATSNKDGRIIHVEYRAHVQKSGWQAWARDGVTVGKPGSALRIEALGIRALTDDGSSVSGVRYQAYVQNEGWQTQVGDGNTAGSPGRSRRVEALRVSLANGLENTYDVWYRLYVEGYGWLGWASNGATAGTVCKGKRVEALEIRLQPTGSEAPGSTKRPFVDGVYLSMRGHIQGVGWKNSKNSVGTVGKGRRVEGFSAKLVVGECTGGITYRAHVQSIGWQKKKSNGAYAGTSGRKLRVEAVTFKLTGEAKRNYDVWYRVHVQTLGWLGWTKNGAKAGTEGMSLRVEKIQTKVLPKGSSAPKGATGAVPDPYATMASVRYSAKTLKSTWQKEKKNGKTAGSTAGSSSLEMLNMRVTGTGLPSGSIRYRVHVKNGTWIQAQGTNPAGVSGKPLDAIAIKLTGQMAKLYKVYYRAHVGGIGWLKWTTKNKPAGTDGVGKTIDAVQVKLVFKGCAKPSDKGAVKNTAYYDKAYALQRGQALSKANAKQRRIVDAAYTTPSPGAGLCAGWVEEVYDNAGFGMYFGDADDLYNAYCHYSDLDDLKVGMIVAVSTHTHTYLGGLYGHVCIYVGDGKVMDNVGNIRTMDVDDWLAYYGTTVTPKWGWLGDVNIA